MLCISIKSPIPKTTPEESRRTSLHCPPLPWTHNWCNSSPRIESPQAYGQQPSTAKRPATRPKEKQYTKNSKFHEMRHLANYRLNEQGDIMNRTPRSVLIGQNINCFFGYALRNMQTQTRRFGCCLCGKQKNKRHPAQYSSDPPLLHPPHFICGYAVSSSDWGAARLFSNIDFSCIVYT